MDIFLKDRDTHIPFTRRQKKNQCCRGEKYIHLTVTASFQLDFISTGNTENIYWLN